MKPSAVSVSSSSQAEKPGILVSARHFWRKHGWATLSLVGIGVFMVIMLYDGFMVNVYPAGTPDGYWGDVYRYQCFATMFWRGPQAVAGLNPLQCKAVIDTIHNNALILPQSHFLPARIVHWMQANSGITQPFQTLPIEYPILSLIPFSLPLLAPSQVYPQAFAIEMVVLGLVLYGVIARFAGWRRAAFYGVLMSLGAFATGAGRFDLWPAGVSFAALLLAERRRWTWAYVLLALGALLKFYPALFMAPLLIAHIRSMPAPERFWRSWRSLRPVLLPVSVFVGVCVVFLGISVAINPIETYRQFADLGHRPIQVESVPATIVWIGDQFGIKMTSFFFYGSDNVKSPLSGVASGLMSLLFVVGLVYTLVAIWRGQLSQRRAWLIVLMLFITSGKIFSDQYLIWMFPFVAYDMALTGLVPTIWLMLCALTTYNYPFLFHAQHAWHMTLALRNALLVFLTIHAMPLLHRSGDEQRVGGSSADPATAGALPNMQPEMARSLVGSSGTTS